MEREIQCGGRILALDVGERRIGIAISDETQMLARSLCVLQRRSKAEDFDVLARMVREQEAKAIVVGLPISLDGTEGLQAARIRRYVGAMIEGLAEHGVNLPIVFFDESLSTVTASERMIISGRRKRHRQRLIDAVAAAVILQNYLDSQTSSST